MFLFFLDNSHAPETSLCIGKEVDMNTYGLIMFPIYLITLSLFWIGVTDFICAPQTAKDLQQLPKAERRKFPRITLTLIACMYLHLLTSAVRLFWFHDLFSYLDYVVFFTCEFMVICILSGLTPFAVQSLYDCGMIEHLKKSWIALKLAFLPFLPLNAWLYWECLDSAPTLHPILHFIWEIFSLLFPPLPLMIPIILPLAMNAAYGYIGIKYIRYIRNHAADGRKPSRFHFFLQMIPVCDCISMVFILLKYKENKLDAETPETGTSAKEPVSYPKLYRTRRLLFLLYLCCGILFYFRIELSGPIRELSDKIATSRMPFYEMTEEETHLMQIFAWDDKSKEKIAAGRLTDRQAYILENLRIGLKDIETRYPGGLFRVNRLYIETPGVSDNSKPPPIDRFVFSVSPVSAAEREYKLNLYPAPGSAIEDNLYGYLQEDSYFRYMEEQIEDDIPGFARFNTSVWYDWYLTKYEDYSLLTVEAVLDGTYYAGPRFVEVYIAADGKSVEECNAQKEVLGEILRRIDLPVERYTVYYYDLTAEEISTVNVGRGDAITSFGIDGNPLEDSP